MSTCPFVLDETVIFGFTQKVNPILINNHPRIFLGYKMDDDTIMKIGYSVVHNNSRRNNKEKYSLVRQLIEIKYDISICDINPEYMERRDIEYYKKLNIKN